MKALVLKSYKQLEFLDVPEPVTGNNDVLVRIKSCGICGSDVHGFDGSTGRRIPPLIMGHEAAGIIAACGKDVINWHIGDRVTFDSTIYCSQCDFCRKGQINLCQNRRVLGVSCDEYRQDGAFAEYIAVPAKILYRIPDELTFEKATMVETLSIAIHAVGRTRIRLNDSAVVVGAGIIGLLVISLLRRSGCGTIYAIDVDDKKRDAAHQFGADKFIEANAGLVQSIQQLTNGGVDVAFDAVGNPQGFMTAIKSVRKGGFVTLIGNLSPTADLPLQAVVTRESTLIGSCASAGEYPACIDLLARGDVDVKPLISHVTSLADGQQWFMKLYNKENSLMKVILVP